MSLARKILWNTVSQIIGKVFIAVIGVVIIKLITSYLGKEGYGEYRLAFDYLAFFGIIADMGLYTIGVREMAKSKQDIPKILGNILTVRTIIAVLMIAVASTLVYFIPKYANTNVPPAVWIAGIAVMFNFITSIVSSVLQVELKMEYNSFASVMGKIVNLLYIIFVVFFFQSTDKDAGFYQLVWAGVFGNGIMLLITYYYSSRYTKIRFQFDPVFLKDVLVKAVPYGIALVLNTIYFRIGSISIGYFRSTAEVGIYGVPMAMLEAMGVIPLYFMNAVLPVLTRSLAAKDGRHGKIIQYAFDFLVMGSAPIVAGVLVLAFPIIALVSSPEFLSDGAAGIVGSDVVLQILIFALAFSFINSLFGFILVADNRQIQILIRNAIGACMTIALDIALVPRFGVRAAAFDNIITEFYVAMASYFLAKKYIKFKLQFKTTFKILFSAVIMGIFLYFVRDPTINLIQNKGVFILIPLGALVYFASLFLTKAITPEMLALIRKPKTADATGESIEG